MKFKAPVLKIFLVVVMGNLFTDVASAAGSNVIAFGKKPSYQFLIANNIGDNSSLDSILTSSLSLLNNFGSM